MATSRDLHRSIGQEEVVDDRSCKLVEEEHLDHSHMVELDHTHT